MSSTLNWSIPIDGMPSNVVAALHAAVEDQIHRFTGESDFRSPIADPLAVEIAEDMVIEGWTTALASEFLGRLHDDGGRVQAEVIVAAANAGGRIDRAGVFAIAGWDASERSLKGFTRPVNRIVQEMRDADLLPDEAPRPIEPLYSEARRGYQQARGFEIPGELVPLFRS
jgi:hypothetical protein